MQRMWLLIFNPWHKKEKKNKIRGYKAIHTFTKKTEDKTNDNNHKNNNESNNNNNNISIIDNNNNNNSNNNNKTKIK